MDPIRQGMELEAMLNSEAFTQMIEEMKVSLITQSDEAVRDTRLSDEALLTALRRPAMMRIAINDMVEFMDTLVQQAQNISYEQETALADSK